MSVDRADAEGAQGGDLQRCLPLADEMTGLLLSAHASLPFACLLLPLTLGGCRGAVVGYDVGSLDLGFGCLEPLAESLVDL